MLNCVKFDFYILLKLFIVTVRVTLDGKFSYPTETYSKRVLWRFPTHLLRATGPTYSSICLLVNICYNAIAVALFSDWIALEMHCLNARNRILSESARNSILNLTFLVFCASVCDRNLVCAIKHVIVTFLKMIFSSFYYVKALILGWTLSLWAHFLILCQFRKLSFSSRVSLWLADETEICIFGGEKSELPRGVC